MSAQAPAPRPVTTEFAIGRVIGRTVRIVVGNGLAFFVIAAVVTSPLLLMGAVAFVLMAGDLDIVIQRALSGLAMPASLLGSGAVVGVAVLLGALLLIASLVHGAFTALSQGHAPIGASLRHGLACVLPVLGIASLWIVLLALIQAPLLLPIYALAHVLWGGAPVGPVAAPAAVLLAAAYLVFIAYVLAGFWVLVPVAVVERGGFASTLGRTWHLTRGYRWHALAVVALSGAAAAGLFLMVGWAVDILGAAGVPPLLSRLVAGIVGGALAFATVVYFVVLPSVGYFYLRRSKEGAEIDDLFAVFD
jgi:hypothetical protein